MKRFEGYRHYIDIRNMEIITQLHPAAQVACIVLGIPAVAWVLVTLIKAVL